MKKTSFSTKLSAFGSNTGIVVPNENVKQLGDSKRPPVKVTINEFKFHSTVAVMGGKNLISFSRAHREASGIFAGDEIIVTLTLEEGPRKVEVPSKLYDSLNENGLIQVFDSLTYSKRKEFARQVNDAKLEETRKRRITKIIQGLK